MQAGASQIVDGVSDAEFVPASGSAWSSCGRRRSYRVAGLAACSSQPARRRPPRASRPDRGHQWNLDNDLWPPKR